MSSAFEQAFPRLSFERPVVLTADPVSGWLFVVEQEGVIRTFPESQSADAAPVVLDIREQVLGSDASIESGLLGLALHPQYGDNGYIYVYYLTESTGSPAARLSRFTTSGVPAVADPDSEAVLIELPRDDVKHNGGDLHFSAEGYLFASFGDGACCGDPFDHGQNKTNLFSTIIRIDVDNPQADLAYGIPPDNPFVGNSEGWREEIWAYGLRNPWRFSIHPETQEIWVGDVGEIEFEEINRIVPGGNYGWSIMDGPECFEWPPGSGQGTNCDTEGLILPAWAYGRDVGLAVTGGYIYQGTRRPDLRGRYVFADWGLEHVFVARLDAEARNITDVQKIVDGQARHPSAFGLGRTGELYMLTYFDGNVYRFRQRGPNEAPAGHINLDGPNPVSSSTRFQVETLDVARVRVAVYDVLGRQVATLFESDWLSPDRFSVELNVGNLASGTYLATLIMDQRVAASARVTVIGTR